VEEGRASADMWESEERGAVQERGREKVKRLRAHAGVMYRHDGWQSALGLGVVKKSGVTGVMAILRGSLETLMSGRGRGH